MIRRLVVRTFVSSSLLLFAVDRLWATCPSCKEGLATTARWAQGFNLSIMFMLVMPFAVAGVLGGAIYRASRHRRPVERDERADQ